METALRRHFCLLALLSARKAACTALSVSRSQRSTTKAATKAMPNPTARCTSAARCENGAACKAALLAAAASPHAASTTDVLFAETKAAGLSDAAQISTRRLRAPMPGQQREHEISGSASRLAIRSDSKAQRRHNAQQQAGSHSGKQGSGTKLL